MTEKKMKTKIEHTEEIEAAPDPEPKTLTGGISIPSTISASGSWTTTPTITTTGTGITVGGGITVPMPAPTVRAAKPKPSKLLDAPNKRPKKILIAFLDGDDEVEWCAKVHPDEINFDMASSDPATRLNLGVWLIEAD